MFAGSTLQHVRRLAAAVVRRRRGGASLLRRDEGHFDAPPRPPLHAARELGVASFDALRSPVPVERELPRDLDMPLAAFDPFAIPATPAVPVPLAEPLAKLAMKSPPAVQDDAPPPIATPRTDATIHALLERLERSIGRREAAVPPPAIGLARTLDELRSKAMRGAA
ncbi:hypothetical protein [Sphingomonas sp. RS2018]